MTPLNEVREFVLSVCTRRDRVEVTRANARGLVLAEDVVASEPVPPFANTAVDGYAIQANDTASGHAELEIIGEVAAGAVADVSVVPGTAIRIMTGAPIPDGCDAVVMVEDTERVGNDRVHVNRVVESGASIRARGSDVSVGATVLTAGTVVTPMVEGVLASINAQTVTVYRRVRVGVMSTGDELVDDGSPLQPGQIRESNRTMLMRIVEEAGAEAVDLGIIQDDERILEEELRKAVDDVQCDVLVTSGGVSMGDYDVVKAVLGRIANMKWFQIAMKPAKPFAFGTLVNDRGVEVPIFGLPGNPVSSLMSFELIARPALRSLMGRTDIFRPEVKAIVDEDVARRPDGKIHFDRVHASWGSDGRVHVRRTGEQGSHQLAATAVANAIMAVPDGDGLNSGDEVLVTFLGPDAGPRASS